MFKKVQVSDEIRHTMNPLRNFLEKKAKRDPNHPKKFINFSVGDPTMFPDFPTEQSCRDAIAEAVLNHPNAFSSTEAAGSESTRMFLASLFSTPKVKLHPDQFILTNGASPGLWGALRCFVGPGDEVLVPCPGFPLPSTIVSSYGGISVGYNYLNHEGQWLIDTRDIRSKITEKTKAILINNPSNPLGCGLPKNNLLEVVKIAKEFKIPIITDEIYEDMVHPNAPEPFVPMRKLTDQVPIIVSSGLSKKYLMPGARLGWCILFGPRKLFTNIIPCMQEMFRELRAPTFMQLAVPDVIINSSHAVVPTLTKYENNLKKLRENLEAVDSFTLDSSNSSFYATISLQMHKFQDLRTTEDVALALLKEENIMTFPGIFFGRDSFLRLVICSPLPEFDDFCQRFTSFCKRHQNLQKETETMIEEKRVIIEHPI